jgi:hypothetical protein
MRREPEELVEVGAISGAVNIPLGKIQVKLALSQTVGGSRLFLFKNCLSGFTQSTGTYGTGMLQQKKNKVCHHRLSQCENLQH